MAATYGYGGEFSSDEDIDRLEQQSEGLLPKFGGQQALKPTKQQIEEIITTIRQIPADQEVNLSDEYLIALLDYYKVQRGPVVDSTRKLYKRLILKRIRVGEHVTASNGESNNLNGNGDNNNSIGIINKRLQPIVQQVEPTSSDDDEPMPPASSQSSVDQQTRRKFDSRVAYTNDKPEPMEVDTAAPVTPALGEIRTTKQVDISSSEDESDEGSDSGESSDSEELDITPLKKPAQQQVGSVATTSKIIASTPIKDSATKVPPVTPKDLTKSKSKTPHYTRSQRVATRSSSGTNKTSKTSTDVSSSKASDSQSSAQVKTLNKSTLTSFENCSRSLSKIKLNQPSNLNIVEDENGEIVFGSTINGRKLNYAEKVVLMSMSKQAQLRKKFTKHKST